MASNKAGDTKSPHLLFLNTHNANTNLCKILKHLLSYSAVLLINFLNGHVITQMRT